MDSFKITIRNYRSIPYNNPITLEIKEGITFILGVNNVGKPNLLKFFYEFRSLSIEEGNTKSFPNGLTYEKVKNQASTQGNIIFSLGNDNLVFQPVFTVRSSPSVTASSYGVQFKMSETITETVIKRPHLQNNFPLFYTLLEKSMYVGAFRTIVNSGASYFDIQIGENVIQNWDTWANGNSIAQKKKVKELKEELKNMFGFKKFEMSVSQDKRKLNIETENGFYDLDELGAGISHYVLTLINAMIKEPSFILIDEPENGLHPKMQEQFVRVLASKAKYGVIATSHSIGLARSVADNIYTLIKQKDDGKLVLKPFGENYQPRLVDVINEMSYSQYTDIGGNHVLLVEGNTEVKVFKEILRKYHIEQHIIILSLGGSNMINKDRYEELSELKRLNAQSYNVIFDSEKTSKESVLSEKLQGFFDTCKNLGFYVFATDYHSTENYITQDALDAEFGENQYTACTPFEDFNKKDKTQKWGKNLNWKAFAKMRLEYLEHTELHKFIKEMESRIQV